MAETRRSTRESLAESAYAVSGHGRDRAPAAETDGNAADAASPIKRLTDGARVMVAMLVSLVIAVAMEQWIRLRLLLQGRNRAWKTGFVNRCFRIWGRSTLWTARLFLGLDVHVEGRLPTSGRYLILANHQSSFDVPILLSVFRDHNLKFVAMEELRHGKPAVSLALRHGGCVFVAKKDLGADLAALRRFGLRLHEYDGSAVIFPEGRRTVDGSILPFTPAGTEVVSAACRLPLLPVTIDGLWKAKSLKDYRRIVGARVTVRISDPVSFEDTRHDPRGIYKRIEMEMRRNLEEIRGRGSPG